MNNLDVKHNGETEGTVIPAYAAALNSYNGGFKIRDIYSTFKGGNNIVVCGGAIKNRTGAILAAEMQVSYLLSI